MNRWAHFDDDGVCQWIVSHKPEGLEVYEAPEGVLCEDIWFDGDNVRLSEEFQDFPTEISVALEPFIFELPANTIGIVNGEYCGNTVTVPTGRSALHMVEVLGAYKGVFRVNVRSYADERRDAYPPIEDQLDALWKGGPAAQDMMRRIQAVKSSYPKPDEPTA